MPALPRDHVCTRIEEEVLDPHIFEVQAGAALNATACTPQIDAAKGTMRCVDARRRSIRSRSIHTDPAPIHFGGVVVFAGI